MVPPGFGNLGQVLNSGLKCILLFNYWAVSQQTTKEDEKCRTELTEEFRLFDY